MKLINIIKEIKFLKPVDFYTSSAKWIREHFNPETRSNIANATSIEYDDIGVYIDIQIWWNDDGNPDVARFFYEVFTNEDYKDEFDCDAEDEDAEYNNKLIVEAGYDPETYCLISCKDVECVLEAIKVKLNGEECRRNMELAGFIHKSI